MAVWYPLGIGVGGLSAFVCIFHNPGDLHCVYSTDLGLLPMGDSVNNGLSWQWLMWQAARPPHGGFVSICWCATTPLFGVTRSCRFHVLPAQRVEEQTPP